MGISDDDCPDRQRRFHTCLKAKIRKEMFSTGERGSVVKNINKLFVLRSVFHPLRPAPRPSLDKHVKLSVNDATTRDSVSISVNYRYQL